MPKTILITGSTDGIGFETAKTLLSLGHNVLIHGRNLEKLEKIGVNHVAINLRFNQANIEKTLEKLARDVLPHFNKS